MRGYWIKIPSWFQQLLPRWQFRVPNSQAVYLTFDDGPSPQITEWLLNELEKAQAKATFFCLGKQAALYPQLVKNIIQSKHTLGNHTWSHADRWKTSTKIYTAEIQKTHQLLTDITGYQTKLFRPPYGHFRWNTNTELRKIGYTPILWEIMPGDFDNACTARQCHDRIIKYLTPGSIIVLHDSEKTADKIRQLIPPLLAQLRELSIPLRALP
jgi:peptidoglycan/xylan/chitin deacetylase (PgdA/CDA1 family)